MSSQTDTPNTSFARRWLGVLWMTALLGALAWLGASRNAMFLVPPFGATLAILLYLPDAPIARPRAVIVGSLLGASLGTLLAALLGAGPLTAVLAALSSALVLTGSRTFHPPGVALAMYPALLHTGVGFPLEVVLPFTLIAILTAPWVRARTPRQFTLAQHAPAPLRRRLPARWWRAARGARGD